MTGLATGFFLCGMMAMSSAAQAAPDCRSAGHQAACPPAIAGAAQSASKSKSAAKSPALLAEPHAVDKARPSSAKARTQAVANSKLAASHAAHAGAAASPHKAARHPRALAQAARRNRPRPMRQAQRGSVPASPGSLAQGGPALQTPSVPPALASGCDEACQYRDWLNRYAAWYRDFGRYYYGAPPGTAAVPRRPVPPPASYSENRPAPLSPAQRIGPDQTERDRLDPWHGYNPHDGLGNGY